MAGPADEKGTQIARERKDANKGARANHNRRDQRARKMAREAVPPEPTALCHRPTAHRQIVTSFLSPRHIDLRPVIKKHGRWRSGNI
ncbi:MAG: hypothetical protein Q9170_007185 [Blastenia crenularia]